jgi:alanyl-tRNA synthetase
MQQHTGQHLLSAVLMDLYGIETAGFHLGAASSTIDVAAPVLEPEQVLAVEMRANERVAENRPVAIAFEGDSEALELRRATERQGSLRIVTIEGLDRSACGGTHVRSTAEIGPVLIRKLERIRGIVRIEFLCGLRAARRARADFDALDRIARVFSAPLDEAPALVEAQHEAASAAQKAHRRAAGELARYRGKELYLATAPGAEGVRRALQRRPSGALDEELHALARGFTAQPKAVFVALIEDPPAVLLAVSDDAGLNAGALLKMAVTKHGGRGGGSAQMAQGSVPAAELFEVLLADLLPRG